MGSKVSKSKQTIQVAPETATVSHNSRKNTRFAKLAGNAGKMKKRFVRCFTRGDNTAVVPDVELFWIGREAPGGSIGLSATTVATAGRDTCPPYYASCDCHLNCICS
ncbi:hypothetical protein Bbelb_397550 [Branchiostoma belcheri]|nr:hypothetical protein Bbelb_397550 [Branchiostoma belcheri]